MSLISSFSKNLLMHCVRILVFDKKKKRKKKAFHAGMHIIIIAICNLQKQMCIKTVAKIVLLLKIRQSKSFVIKHSDIVITGDSSYCTLLPVPLCNN